MKNALKEKDRNEEKGWCLFLGDPVGQRRGIRHWLIPTFTRHSTFIIESLSVTAYHAGSINMKQRTNADNLDYDDKFRMNNGSINYALK